jgi:hypothetical protein
MMRSRVLCLELSQSIWREVLDQILGPGELVVANESWCVLRSLLVGVLFFVGFGPRQQGDGAAVYSSAFWQAY